MNMSGMNAATVNSSALDDDAPRVGIKVEPLTDSDSE
jgi:hypothetical protein